VKPVGDEEVEAIERATLAAVSPGTVEELPGWLLPFDAGTIARASSAVPLRHDVDASAIGTIEARYQERGLPAVFRLADDPRMGAVQTELYRRGYRPEQPTLVQIAASAALGAVTDEVPAETAAAPDDGWKAIFVGEGFDPVDGTHRINAFGRAPDAVYASVRGANDRTLAVGLAAFAFGWAGVHGMRTDQAHRGQGLGRRVLAGLAEAVLARAVERVFLQVEVANQPARTLYLRAGFESVWRYFYWRRRPR
jgi:N-acetylglutamate synthase